MTTTERWGGEGRGLQTRGQTDRRADGRQAEQCVRENACSAQSPLLLRLLISSRIHPCPLAPLCSLFVCLPRPLCLCSAPLSSELGDLCELAALTSRSHTHTHTHNTHTHTPHRHARPPCTPSCTRPTLVTHPTDAPTPIDRSAAAEPQPPRLSGCAWLVTPT